MPPAPPGHRARPPASAPGSRQRHPPAAARAAVLLAVLLASCGQPGPTVPAPSQPSGPTDSFAPEAASGFVSRAGRSFTRQAVAAAHPLAAEAGLAVLRAGGSALDAAIAAQAVLGVVEPQSSGIGGGAFLLHWDTRRVQAYDGRETAPAAASESLFTDARGQPLPFEQARVGGRAVAVPGLLRMLEMAHREHGVLPWARLFEPAIALAERGFPLGARLHGQLRTDPSLRRDPRALALFYRADGEPHPAGHTLRNPALAAVLRAVAAQGSVALHRGPVAADLVARVQGDAVPGSLRAADLANYRALEREPLCTDWRERWRVCGMPPPSSGHLTLMQILLLLDRAGPLLAPAAGQLPGADSLHRYAEAARLAYADRAAFVADPAFVPAPAGRWDSLLDAGYMAQRAMLIGARAMPAASAGQPGGKAGAFAPMALQREHGTSHVSVIDSAGRAVALTSSIESQFGARILADGGTGLAGGYLLNNHLTDFAFQPADAQGRPVANRLQPGKRPRSSMSPTLVFDRRTGELVMSLGSAGGAAIIHHVARTLIATLDWGLDLQAALDQPHAGTVGGPLLLEQGRWPPDRMSALQGLGHRVVEAEQTSGLHAIARTGAGAWRGGADPRREGAVLGD